MLRRFSINFALLSMALDVLAVVFSLWLARELRPFLNGLPGVESISASVIMPGILLYIFPLLWIFIYSALSIYDGRKYLRVVDEFSTLSFAMGIASVSAAGILYFSYRDVLRFLFLLFILSVSLLCLLLRLLLCLLFLIPEFVLSKSSRRFCISC